MPVDIDSSVHFLHFVILSCANTVFVLFVYEEDEAEDDDDTT